MIGRSGVPAVAAFPDQTAMASRFPSRSRPVAVTLALLVAAVATSACGTTHRRPFRERQAEFMEPYEDLKRQKADLWRAGWQPQEFEFADHGTVTVHRWELVGWPGDVYVQADLTYENTTDQPVGSAFVWLDVLDHSGEIVGSTAVRMLSPLGFAFWPGHTYTTQIRARTNGVHLDEEGWNWTIACDAPVEQDPGEKPVLINPDLEYRRSLWHASPSRYHPTFSRHYSGPHVPGVTRY